MPDIAISFFGDSEQNCSRRWRGVSPAIDLAYGFIRTSVVTDTACHDGNMLRWLVTGDNLAAGVWSDTAYRSKANEAWLAGKGQISHIHRNKPKTSSNPPVVGGLHVFSPGRSNKNLRFPGQFHFLRFEEDELSLHCHDGSYAVRRRFPAQARSGGRLLSIAQTG